MEQEEQKLNSLPDNAYRELRPGEEYKPIMPANTQPKEVTTYSVVFRDHYGDYIFSCGSLFRVKGRAGI